MNKNQFKTILNIFKKKLTLNTFTIFIALYYIFIFNLPFFSGIKNGLTEFGEPDYFFVLSIPFFVFCLFLFLFSFLSVKYLVKPIFILLLLSSTVVFYATFHYGTIFDNSMIENIMETNHAEALSYFNNSFLITFLTLGVLPSYWIFRVQIIYRGWKKEIIRKIGFMAASLGLAILIPLPIYGSYASFFRKNSYLSKVIIPTQYIWSLKNYIEKKYDLLQHPFREIGKDAKFFTTKKNQKRNLIIVVLGETARAENFEYQGYNKPTNTHTQIYNAIYFKNVSSCGTSTRHSVPCMFSNLTRSEFSQNIAINQSSTLDILNYSGYDVEWIDNDGGCKDICNRIKHIIIPFDNTNYLCNGEYCQDEIVLKYFDKLLIQNTDKNRLIGIHLLGSHGPDYYRRYPKEHRFFKPDCTRSDIQKCSHETLLNTYDNTILYTDYILAQVIQRLQKLEAHYNTALLYISDHGESLGEKGLYLHGIPYMLAPSQQTHVPLLLWLSSSFNYENQINESCLKHNAITKQYSHDNIFHSLLGLSNVDTKIYDANLDIFSGCRKKQ